MLIYQTIMIWPVVWLFCVGRLSSLCCHSAVVRCRLRPVCCRLIFCFYVSTFFRHDYFSLAEQTWRYRHVHAAAGYIRTTSPVTWRAHGRRPDTGAKYRLVFSSTLYKWGETTIHCLLLWASVWELSRSIPAVSLPDDLSQSVDCLWGETFSFLLFPHPVFFLK